MPKRPYSEPVPETALRIRQERIAAGLTQEELAERLQTSAVTVGRYESGDRQVTVARLIQIASVLSIPPARLIENGDGLTQRERDLLAFMRENEQDATILMTTYEAMREMRAKHKAA